MAETSGLLLDGAEPQQLDKALTSFGFPVGPASLADEVGIDVAGHVQEVRRPRCHMRCTVLLNIAHSDGVSCVLVCFDM